MSVLCDIVSFAYTFLKVLERRKCNIKDVALLSHGPSFTIHISLPQVSDIYMQPYRVTRTKLPTFTRSISNPSQANKASTMACYTMQPRFHPFGRPVAALPRPSFPFGELESLFTLLDAPAAPRGPHRHGPRQARTFQPRFDVRENPEAFHLQGELPGMGPENVSIEFTGHDTLVVKGKVVREKHEGDRSLAEGTEQPKAVADADQAETQSNHSGSHQATVEDDFEEVTAEKASETPATATANAEAVEKPEATPAPGKKDNDNVKYWVSERSIGEFHRSFTFPGQVQHDAVKASLKNGILNVEVPKVKKQEPRKITIE